MPPLPPRGKTTASSRGCETNDATFSKRLDFLAIFGRQEGCHGKFRAKTLRQKAAFVTWWERPTVQRQGRFFMPVQSHLVELERKHQALEMELGEAMAHPSYDDLKIAELKRRKLLLKDEITRLRKATTVH
jgi:hypothetical protein